MKKIKSNSELKQLNANSKGLIYNDFSGKGAGGKEYNVLHAAYCHWVLRSNINVPKYFFNSLEKAIKWLKKNRGIEGKKWKRCGTCKAEPRKTTTTQPTIPTIEESYTLKGPFRESVVEEILVQSLKQEGYDVQKQVKVHSGIIDVVAKGPDGNWIIEVKGEDRGGYTSAEMNFQVGLGQIISRMTDPQNNYALAFPMTTDFKRVLRKYKGTIGFELLNITFFIVHLDKRTDKYKASSMREFINRL